MFRLYTDQKWIYRILRHLLLFLSMVLLFTWVAHSRSGEGTGLGQDLLLVTINAVVFFGYAYLTIYLLIPHVLARKKVFLFAGAFLLSGIGLSVLKFLFSDYIFYQALAPEDTIAGNNFSLPSLLVNTKDMSFIVAIFAIAKFARDHHILESNIRELQHRGLVAEIKLMQHQMDPHVIFNNFNNLYSISIFRPDLLESTVKKLKSILHYLFQESKHEKVPLSEEIEMIRNYIGLEELRFGERLHATFSVEGDPAELEIAPLILYPFVENCFVHGAGEDPLPSWICIEVSVNNAELRFFASNSVSESADRRRQGRGSGHENIIRRLEIQYPNSHRLAIMDRPLEHRVELNIRL